MAHWAVREEGPWRQVQGGRGWAALAAGLTHRPSELRRCSLRGRGGGREGESLPPQGAWASPFLLVQSSGIEAIYTAVESSPWSTSRASSPFQAEMVPGEREPPPLAVLAGTALLRASRGGGAVPCWLFRDSPISFSMMFTRFMCVMAGVRTPPPFFLVPQVHPGVLTR